MVIGILNSHPFRSINGIFLVDGLECVFPSSELEYGLAEETWNLMVDECSSRYPIAECTAATMEKLHEFEKVKYQIVAWSRESADRLKINLRRDEETSVDVTRSQTKWSPKR